MPKEIAMGFENCLDYQITWDSPLITRMLSESGVREEDIHDYTLIRSEKEFLGSLLFRMREERGGNYAMENSSLVEAIARRFSFTPAMGGTGVRAALALEKAGVPSLIHLTTRNAYTDAMNPQSGEYYCASGKETLFPHLIFQYPPGELKSEAVRVSPRSPNRVIYSCDETSERLAFNHDFYEKAIKGTKVLQFGCFESVTDASLLAQLIDYTAPRLREAREGGTIVYQEMGCFHSEETKNTVLRRMSHAIDIVGMNEDELASFTNGPLNLDDPRQVLRALDSFHARYPVPVIVVHTKYWALARGRAAPLLRSCLSSGIAMATARLRHGDDFTMESVRETSECPRQERGLRFRREIEALSSSVCVESSIVVKETNLTTVGLGDTFLAGFFLELRKIPRKALLLRPSFPLRRGL